MKKLISFVCPSCGANISADDDREFTFCQFCGKRISISDENKQTYRHIDDAEVIRAKTDNELSLKKIELEEKRIDSKKKITIIAVIASFVFMLILVAIMILGRHSTTTFVFGLMSSWFFVFLIGVAVGISLEKSKKGAK